MNPRYFNPNDFELMDTSDTSSCEAPRSWTQRCQPCKKVRLWKYLQKLSWSVLRSPGWKGMVVKCGIGFRSNLRSAMIQAIAFKIIMAEHGAGCQGCKIRDVDLETGRSHSGNNPAEDTTDIHVILYLIRRQCHFLGRLKVWRESYVLFRDVLLSEIGV